MITAFVIFVCSVSILLTFGDTKRAFTRTAFSDVLTLLIYWSVGLLAIIGVILYWIEAFTHAHK